MARKRKRVELFGDEVKIFKEEKERLRKEDLTMEEAVESSKRLLQAYKDLIDQSKLSTKISDKLIFGLNENYSDLMDENKTLQDKIGKHESSFWSKLFNWK